MNEEVCLCFARDARELDPERYAWCGNVLWAQWKECPTHHEHFMSPVWHPRMGQLRDEATAYEAVALSEELS